MHAVVFILIYALSQNVCIKCSILLSTGEITRSLKVKTTKYTHKNDVHSGKLKVRCCIIIFIRGPDLMMNMLHGMGYVSTQSSYMILFKTSVYLLYTQPYQNQVTFQMTVFSLTPTVWKCITEGLRQIFNSTGTQLKVATQMAMTGQHQTYSRNWWMTCVTCPHVSALKIYQNRLDPQTLKWWDSREGHSRPLDQRPPWSETTLFFWPPFL